MDHREALQLIRERAVVKYGFKQGNLLRYLVERLHPGKKKNKDIGYIQKTVKVSTLQEKAGFISERQLRRYLDDLNDALILRWENKFITYKVNLKPLVDFDYEGALNRLAEEEDAKRADRATKARQKYAADRKQRKLEEMREFFSALPDEERRNILKEFNAH